MYGGKLNHAATHARQDIDALKARIVKLQQEAQRGRAAYLTKGNAALCTEEAIRAAEADIAVSTVMLSHG